MIEARSGSEANHPHCLPTDREGMLCMANNRATLMDDAQIQAFPRPTTAALAPQPAASPGFALYIDADNQSAHCAAALLDVLQQGLSGQVTRVTLAGNDKGNKNALWISALREQIPESVIENLVVPCRPNAADIALILALGADLAEHRRTRTAVVLVSRDTLLLDAAEQVREAGVRLYVAYADGEVPTARRATLTTFLLPAPAEPPKTAAPAPVAVPITTAAAKVAQTPSPIANALPAEITRAMAHVRATCKQQPGGGYSATDVGQALVKLGYATPAARREILARFPQLQTKGEAAQKRLVF